MSEKLSKALELATDYIASRIGAADTINGLIDLVESVETELHAAVEAKETAERERDVAIEWGKKVEAVRDTLRAELDKARAELEAVRGRLSTAESLMDRTEAHNAGYTPAPTPAPCIPNIVPDEECPIFAEPREPAPVRIPDDADCPTCKHREKDYKTEQPCKDCVAGPIGGLPPKWEPRVPMGEVKP